jgi:hypothetical protein
MRVRKWELRRRDTAGRVNIVPCRTKRVAIEVAQFWCDRAGMSAELVRFGHVILRYWYDGGLQLIEY